VSVVASWITLYPQWFISERNAMERSYPRFRVDERALRAGVLRYYGELVIRPSGGAKRQPVRVGYPASSPFEPPVVVPIEALPEFDGDGAAKSFPDPIFFNRRHQMASGALCLFQRDTRGATGGEWISVIDVLRRAEEWLVGHHTGRWPPDSRESELETHFFYGGDILLSGTFYTPEIAGSGTFHMVRDMRRLLDGVSKEDPPLIVTVLTYRREGIDVVLDARRELENIYPWLSNEAWSPEKLSEFEGRKTDDYWRLVADHGYWWSLPEEPRPFRDGAGLLKELERVATEGDAWKLVSGALGSDLTIRSKHFFGLRYPGRSGEPEWLVLRLTGKAKETTSGGVVVVPEDDKRRDFERAYVECFHVHGARAEEIQLRNTNVVKRSVREKTVALIGLGALGSKVAELLAQAGVGTFRLCDLDRLATGNVARHVGGLTEFGARKTRVVMTRLFNINPHLTISDIWDDSAVSNLDKLAAFMEPADLTISTIADENVESAINQIAIVGNKIVVYGRAMRSGGVGRVFVVRPGIDPCKMCLGLYAQESRAGKAAPPDWIDVTEREEDVLLHECGRPVIPASAVDLSFVASLIARVSLDVLEDNATSHNHWLWSREPAVELDQRLDKRFVTICGALPKHAGCPACSEPDVARVMLPQAVCDAIRAEVEANKSVETGGILLGFVDEDRRAVIVSATGPGPKATKSATGFDRDVEFVQAELERSAKEHGERGLYLGEWHSHLETDPEPSGRDIMSMSGIAAAQNYATRCPIMLIAGLDTQTGKVAVLKTWAFPLSGRVFPIEHEVVAAS
jgi:integrative and conjugative element protein (TIGR02256 family)